MLDTTGLDEAHESAYSALVAVGAADVPALARLLALGEYDTERALRGLERHGLAARSSGLPGRWVATRRREPEQAEQAPALLAERYRAAATEPAAHDLVEVVTGTSAVARRFRQLRLGAREEVCALVTGTPVATIEAGDGDDAAERTAAPGVRHRVVVERAVLDRPHGVRELTAALGREERVRVVDRVPTNLVVADRSLALVPLTGSGSAEPAVLVVRAGGLLELLTGLFESVWREALPLRVDPEGAAERGADAPDGPERPRRPHGAHRPDSTDLEILSLLLAGLTDASVAKRLDLGLRTVQRRVKGLMEATGASTRLQLGWRAYERGWVTRGH